jgi:hypothetical protein
MSALWGCCLRCGRHKSTHVFNGAECASQTTRLELIPLFYVRVEIYLQHIVSHYLSSHRKKSMKNLLHIAVLGLLMVTTQAQAENEKMIAPSKATPKATEEKKHKGAQQEKMKRCNAEAKGMKGDERKAKMRACLKG